MQIPGRFHEYLNFFWWFGLFPRVPEIYEKCSENSIHCNSLSHEMWREIRKCWNLQPQLTNSTHLMVRMNLNDASCVFITEMTGKAKQQPFHFNRNTNRFDDSYQFKVFFSETEAVDFNRALFCRILRSMAI